jgi:nitroreductase
MEVSQALQERRSIRKFKEDPVSKDLLLEILEAATLAPSGKNKQPWKFYVVQGEKRVKMIQTIQTGMDRLANMGIDTGSAKFTIRVMEKAPVTIFVFNPTSKHPLLKRDAGQVYADMVDIQSIGAAIENMLLKALDLGLGTLWICDIFFGYEELCEWFGENGELIAAVSLGYPQESPSARPRKPVESVTEFWD